MLIRSRNKPISPIRIGADNLNEILQNSSFVLRSLSLDVSAMKPEQDLQMEIVGNNYTNKVKMIGSNWLLGEIANLQMDDVKDRDVLDAIIGSIKNSLKKNGEFILEITTCRLINSSPQNYGYVFLKNYKSEDNQNKTEGLVFMKPDFSVTGLSADQIYDIVCDIIISGWTAAKTNLNSKMKPKELFITINDLADVFFVKNSILDKDAIKLELVFNSSLNKALEAEGARNINSIDIDTVKNVLTVNYMEVPHD